MLNRLYLPVAEEKGLTSEETAVPASPSSTSVRTTLADRAIPLLSPPRLPTLERARIPVDLNDPRSREDLIDVGTLGVKGDNFYARRDGSNSPYNQSIDGAIDRLLLRESVANMVAKVDLALRRVGLGIYIFDGYRSVATQRGLWSFFWQRFASADQSLTEADVEARTVKFVSDPRAFRRDDPRTCPLHSTGGAVDLTLVDASGSPLDLGTPFDDPSEAAATAFFEEALLQQEIGADDPRLRNRRVLYWSMREAGFTNYLYEWWHFDWGNQMHILTLELLGSPSASGSAWYGYTEPPGPDVGALRA